LPTQSKLLAGSLVAAALVLMPVSDSGAAETTIKIGNTAPYSGPASAYGTIARAEAAYFRMLNDQGGINGRQIDFLTLDDAYSPAKTVEQTRKLVEQDEVLAMFSAVGTAPNISVQKYLNAKRIRNCSSRPERRAGTTPNISRGRSVSTRPTNRRAVSMHSSS
jgi:branched-chain amino acid transport system substrate-binding protein